MPAPPSPEENEPPPNEAEQLHAEISRVTGDSLNSTRRMFALCSESKDMGIKTLVALDHQGKKLDNVENKMTDIEKDMEEANKALKGMKAANWGLRMPCTAQ